MKRLGAILLVASVLGGAVKTAAGASCAPRTHLSTCINADTFWPRPGPSEFAYVGGAQTTPTGQAGFGMVVAYAKSPIMLAVPSAAASGAKAPAVDDLWNATMLFSLGLGDRLELGAALPLTLSRSGTGVSLLTSQVDERVPRTALGDVRFGAAFRLLPRARAAGDDELALTARFDVSAPTGDERSFAGDRSWVGAPSFAALFRHGALSFGAELGARLRETSDLLGSPVGTQALIALGVGATLWDAEKLRFKLEGLALPGIVSEKELEFDPATGKRIVKSTSMPPIPAEWLGSIEWGGLMEQRLTATVGFGTGIGSAITTPNVRAILSLRFTPK